MRNQTRADRQVYPNGCIAYPKRYADEDRDGVSVGPEARVQHVLPRLSEKKVRYWRGRMGAARDGAGWSPNVDGSRRRMC